MKNKKQNNQKNFSNKLVVIPLPHLKKLCRIQSSSKIHCHPDRSNQRSYFPVSRKTHPNLNKFLHEIDTYHDNKAKIVKYLEHYIVKGS